MYSISIMVYLLPRYSGIASRDLCSDRLVLWGGGNTALVLWGGGNTALNTVQLSRMAGWQKVLILCFDEKNY